MADELMVTCLSRMGELMTGSRLHRNIATGGVCVGCLGLILSRENIRQKISSFLSSRTKVVLATIVQKLTPLIQDEVVAETSDAPVTLRMRSAIPPSFWEPESPVYDEMGTPATIDDTQWNMGTWGREQGNYSGWDKQPPKRKALRQTDAKTSSVPIGPDSPSRLRDPSRPDWASILGLGPASTEPQSRTHSDGRTTPDSMSDSFLSRNEVYPDEMTAVTEDDIRREQERAKERSQERAIAVRRANQSRALSYSDYLRLDRILDAQLPQSMVFDQEVHDEMLFIIIHQTYELWFKQMLYELDSVVALMGDSSGHVPEADLYVCANRTERCCHILKVLVHQFDVLETMSPQGFGDFRDFLSPASGFQSKQFRLVENKLGMRAEQRIQHSGCPYYRHLPDIAEQQEVQESERQDSLLDFVSVWLERLLAECCGDWDFAAYMRNAIEQAANHDRVAIQKYPAVTRNAKQNFAAQNNSAAALEELEKKRTAHLKLFDPEAHQELVDKGIRHMSFKATMACVFIQSFSTDLALQSSHRLVSNLVAIDEDIARWRHRHSSLVLRMIGSKNGTGGSSGHAYLNKVMDRSRIFIDLCHASHYLLPQHSMPPLPPQVKARLQRRQVPWKASDDVLLSDGPCSRAKSFS
mmetsp:Transcript_46469/g.109992  ORF Transcript_46469/g.109992 Transcript_46469/m.109992 type:complete len:639 (+) Transcript_46469:3-1919(+)